MRIESITTYTMYLSAEEFELLHSITSEVPYGYRVVEEEEEEYELKLTEDMLDEIKDLLEREAYVQKYEEYNRARYEEIVDLQNSIYYELD
jgi:hypothetical protein